MRKYYGTKILGPSGTGIAVYIDKDWGFNAGDVVTFHVRNINSDEDIIRTKKRICKTGGSAQCIYMDRDWGFKMGDMITIVIERDDDDTDSRSKTKERNQGLS